MADPVDLEVLDRFFMSDSAPENGMGLSDLDGFLTGILVGPELIMPSEWLPHVWGGEAPVFEIALRGRPGYQGQIRVDQRPLLVANNRRIGLAKWGGTHLIPLSPGLADGQTIRTVAIRV